jgi:hypothetical protein
MCTTCELAPDRVAYEAVMRRYHEEYGDHVVTMTMPRHSGVRERLLELAEPGPSASFVNPGGEATNRYLCSAGAVLVDDLEESTLISIKGTSIELVASLVAVIDPVSDDLVSVLTS